MAAVRPVTLSRGAPAVPLRLAVTTMTARVEVAVGCPTVAR